MLDPSPPVPVLDEFWTTHHAPPGAPPHPGGSDRPHAGGSADTFRVLMVDDEELIRRMAAGMARRINVDLVAVGTADEALEVAGTSGIDLLIADVVLGEGSDGIDLVRRVHQAHPTLSVVLMSGYSESHFDLDGLPEGTQFLLKPFTSDSFARCIATARQQRPGR
ncbi:MAG: response regulator [Vicinamibacterales bacterium]